MSGRRIMQAVAVAFLAISAGGAVLMLAWGSYSDPLPAAGLPGV